MLLRQGLRRLLEDEPDFDIVAEADNPAEMLRQVAEFKPEVVLLGRRMFALTVDEAERLIQKESPRSAVVMIDGRTKAPVVFEAADSVHATESGTSIKELVSMIRVAARARKTGIHPMPRRDHESADQRKLGKVEAFAPRNRELTARESEVLKLLAEGKTVRASSEILGVSVKTVDAHKFNLMRKLGVHNKAELVMCAIQRRVVKVPANF